MEISAIGDTEKERQSYASGVRMGFFYAAKLLKDAAEKAKEKAGACPAGPLTNAANIIESRMPKGGVEASFRVK